MSKFTRRRFLIAGGAGAIAVAAGGAALAIRQLTQTGSSSTGSLTFQAVAALPRPPLVSYASYVIAGQVNLGSNTGTIIRTVFAGDPNDRLPIALLTRSVRVTNVETQGSTRRITGMVNNPSQLQKGETANFTIVIDPNHHTAQTDFYGSPIELQVQQWKVSS